jgi:hypothetical protein
MSRYITTATWTDPTWYTTKEDALATEQSLRGHERNLAERTATLDALKELLLPLDAHINALLDLPEDTPIRVRHEIINLSEGLRTRISSTLNDASGNVEYYRSATASHKEHLAALRERLTKYPDDYTGERSVTREEITKQIAKLPNVKPDSIALIDGPSLRWTFVGIRTKPDKCPAWISTPHDAPSIGLPDVRAKIDLATGRLTLAPVRGQRDKARFSWDNIPRVHPHVLDGDMPCLGDFTGPIREALDELDFNTVVTLIRLFLERAIMSDLAGAHWLNPFKEAIDDTLRSMSTDAHSYSAIGFDNAWCYRGHDVLSLTLKELDVPGCFVLCLNGEAQRSFNL